MAENGETKGAAVITGASAGLGAEYARLFAADGHAVVLVARREDRLRALADELTTAHGTDAHCVAADLMSEVGCDAVKKATDDLGIFVEYLVNNAGFGTQGKFWESPVEKELGQIKLNILALTHLTHLYLPPMLEAGRGRILNIGSTAGFQPGPFMSTYYATKAHVNSFTTALAYELRGTGVTATVHCPGPTATEFAEVAGNDKTKLFKKGAIATAADCAKHGYAKMRAGTPLSVHGFLNSMLAASVRFTPPGLTRAVSASINRP